MNDTHIVVWLVTLLLRAGHTSSPLALRHTVDRVRVGDTISGRHSLVECHEYSLVARLLRRDIRRHCLVMLGWR